MDGDLILLIKTVEAHLRHVPYARITLPPTIRDQLAELDRLLHQRRFEASRILVTPVMSPDGPRGGIMVAEGIPYPLPVPHLLPLAQCHHCEALFDRVSSVIRHEDVPLGIQAPGEPAFCPNCAAVLVFGADLSLGEPTPEDFERFLDRDDWFDWKSQAEETSFRKMAGELVMQSTID